MIQKAKLRAGGAELKWFQKTVLVIFVVYNYIYRQNMLENNDKDVITRGVGAVK